MENPESYIQVGVGGTSYVGGEAERLFRLIVLANALECYAKYKLQVNRAYTPKMMIDAANFETGCTFRRGQYATAAAQLHIEINKVKSTIPIIRI